MLVKTVTSSTQIRVERNIGSTALGITVDDELVVIGSAYPEGAGVGTSVSWDSTVAFNYAQIFRNPYSLTGTADNTYLRTGPTAVEKQAKTLKTHMSDIERAMIWGKKHVLNGGTDAPTYMTGGVINEITTIVDCAGTGDTGADNGMTEAEFDSFLMNTLFAWGSDERLVFCGPKIAEHLNTFAKNRWSPEKIEGTYGVSFVRYIYGSYSLLVHVHPQFRQVPGATYSAMFLDFPELCYRYVQNRDTHLLEDRQDPGEDGITDEYLSQCGLELKTDLPHGWIKNWQNTDAV